MKNILFSITPGTLSKGVWARPGRPVRNAGFWETPAESSRTSVPVLFQVEVSSRVSVNQSIPKKEPAAVSAGRESRLAPRQSWPNRPLRVDGLNFDEAFLVEEEGSAFGLVQVAMKAAKKLSSKPIPKQPSALVRAAQEAAAKLAAKAKAPAVPAPTVQAPVSVTVATPTPVAAPASAPVAQSVTPEQVSKAPPKSTAPKPVKLASFADLARLRW
jgi:hypothetical protein